MLQYVGHYSSEGQLPLKPDRDARRAAKETQRRSHQDQQEKAGSLDVITQSLRQFPRPTEDDTEELIGAVQNYTNWVVKTLQAEQSGNPLKPIGNWGTEVTVTTFQGKDDSEPKGIRCKHNISGIFTIYNEAAQREANEAMAKEELELKLKAVVQAWKERAQADPSTKLADLITDKVLEVLVP